jgi:long-chain fatty acid transport protein
MEIGEGHSVGISPILLVQGFRAGGIQPFAGSSADPANFTDRGRDWSFGAGVRVGYLGQIGEVLSIGAFYQTKIEAGRFDRYAGLFADQGGFDVPASYGIGLALKPSDRLTLAVDAKRIEYSGVASVGTPLAPLFAGVPFGADGGPGFGWNDVDVFKIGAAYKVDDGLELRAGYGHSQNPVPASETFLNILAPGVVQDHFTVGATIGLGSGMELTGYAMHAPNSTVNGSGSIPAPFGGGEANISLAETALGVGFGWSF